MLLKMERLLDSEIVDHYASRFVKMLYGMKIHE